jgi:hypothetical protein
MAVSGLTRIVGPCSGRPRPGPQIRSQAGPQIRRGPRKGRPTQDAGQEPHQFLLPGGLDGDPLPGDQASGTADQPDLDSGPGRERRRHDQEVLLDAAARDLHRVGHPGRRGPALLADRGLDRPGDEAVRRDAHPHGQIRSGQPEAPETGRHGEDVAGGRHGTRRDRQRAEHESERERQPRQHAARTLRQAERFPSRRGSSCRGPPTKLRPIADRRVRSVRARPAGRLVPGLPGCREPL